MLQLAAATGCRILQGHCRTWGCSNLVWCRGRGGLGPKGACVGRAAAALPRVMLADFISASSVPRISHHGAHSTLVVFLDVPTMVSCRVHQLASPSMLCYPISARHGGAVAVSKLSDFISLLGGVPTNCGDAEKTCARCTDVRTIDKGGRHHLQWPLAAREPCSPALLPHTNAYYV
jgi:hypothetical protein